MDAEKISLERRDVKEIVDMLNEYLANYHIYYQKLRGCHWNVKGGHFFSLHAKFQELYEEAIVAIDEVAERILTLGKSPVSTYKEYIQMAVLKEINTIDLADNKMVEAILHDIEQLISIERKLMTATAEGGDDGTNDMINKYMQSKEKNVWMLRAFLGK